MDYFTSLYAGKIETPRTISEDINPVEANEIEIVEAIQKLKNRKSPGEDGITNEMIKHARAQTMERNHSINKTNI